MCGHGVGEGSGMDWEVGFATCVYTPLCKTDSQWGPAGPHTELSAGLCGDLGVGWVTGGDVCTHIADSLCCAVETSNIVKQLSPDFKRRRASWGSKAHVRQNRY